MFSIHAHTRRERTHIQHGVFSFSASFLLPRRTPNTKRHLQWCLFVLGVIPTSSNTCQTRRDTFNGVCLCSASFLYPPMHAEHKETPLMVSVRARRLSYIHRHTLSTDRHLLWCLFVLGFFPHPPMHAEREKTPSMVSVRARLLSTSADARRSRRDTFNGVCFGIFPTSTDPRRAR